MLAGAQPLVDRDPAPAYFDARVLEAESLDVRLASRGDHQVRRLERLPSLELEPVGARPAFDLLRAPVETEADSLLDEELAKEVPGVPVHPREEVVAALHDRDVGAQARVELRELAADGAAADHHEALRDLARARPVTARPRLDGVEALDGRDLRQRAGGDHQLVVRELASVHLDPARLCDEALAAHDLSPKLLDPLHLARVVLACGLVAPPEDLAGVDRRLDSVGTLGAECDLDRPQERLRGNAGPVRALPADELVLDERDTDLLVEPAQSGNERLAAHSSAQDDDVPRHQCGNGRKDTASVAMSRSGCAAMKLPMVTTTASATDVPRASSRGGEPPAGATLTAGWKYIARTTPR